MCICYAWLNNKIQHPKHMVYPIALLFMAGLPISFSFCYMLNLGPIRLYQTLNYTIFVLIQLYFTLTFSNLRRDRENHAYQRSSPSWLLLLVLQISAKNTFPYMLIGYHVTQIFLKPLSHYFHWSPGHVAIFKLSLANFHSRKHVTSHVCHVKIITYRMNF